MNLLPTPVLLAVPPGDRCCDDVGRPAGPAGARHRTNPISPHSHLERWVLILSPSHR